uniref:Acetyl-CoA carboxylase n=1 Tax=Lygus hesperus TaxID=30085 RepID=A0A0A9XXP6_LYGHE
MRRFVLVANDITFQSGSMAVPEDNVFAAACALARREGLPFVYLSANSGARLGLCDEVKKRFRVAFTPQGEIDYLYITPEDYAVLQTQQVHVSVHEVSVEVGHGNGDDTETNMIRRTEKRFVLDGIVGAPGECLGVENLRGSARLAGEMSHNYTTIPTISVVSGRSVGIGAYLNRLGRRIIQTADSPIILTGAHALNRLLGRDVYVDNAQLGGRHIMTPNGVSH